MSILEKSSPAEIIALEKNWDTYYHSADLNSLINLYADDAVRLPNIQTIISGKEAIRKAMEKAKKSLVRVPRQGSTIPHEVIGEYVSSNVMLKPASPGTGVIAGGAVRAVIELAGIHDVLSKVVGSTNPLNVVMAAINGLLLLRMPEEVARARGKELNELDLPSSYFN